MTDSSPAYSALAISCGPFPGERILRSDATVAPVCHQPDAFAPRQKPCARGLMRLTDRRQCDTALARLRYFSRFSSFLTSSYSR